MNMNSKEIMVNLMVEKICKYIDAGDVNKIVVHGKEFAEVKKGKWQKYHETGLRYKCSVCRSRYSEPWHYCPNCGADMRGDKKMTPSEAIAIMCQRCLNHHMCMGTGCLPKKTLEEAIKETKEETND